MLTKFQAASLRRTLETMTAHRCAVSNYTTVALSTSMPARETKRAALYGKISADSPRADLRCGKVFFSDRRSADGHRIALEFWNRATGRIREGYQLGVYRCKNCGGFHIGWKRIPISLNLTNFPEVGPRVDFPDKPPEWSLSIVLSQTPNPALPGFGATS